MGVLLGGTAQADPPEAKVDFENDIRPIFAKRCYRCHGVEKQEHDLRLDFREPALKGGVSGKAIIPGDAEKSLLYNLIVLPEDALDVMPAKGPLLNDKQKKLIKDWIDQGAEWPQATKKTPERKDS